MSETTEANASPGLLEEYRQWKAIGAGGVPHTWTGFMMNKFCEKTLAFEDTLTLEPYALPGKYEHSWSKTTEAQKSTARSSFLQEPLPVRPGPRARAKPFVFPQRERNASDPQDPAVKAAYGEAFARLSDDDTEWNTSVLEKHGTALFLKDRVPIGPLTGSTQREICHIHGSDLSGHVNLSLGDAQEVIDKGWGERHRMSGTSSIPLGYTMLYAPKTVEETKVFEKIFRAGVAYMKSG